MKPAVKIVGATLGVVGINGLSYGLISDSEPVWSPLTTSETGKYIEHLKNYFVSDAETNQDWWDWSYRNKFAGDTPGDKFKNVKRGYKDKEGNEEHSLKKACKDA